MVSVSRAVFRTTLEIDRVGRVGTLDSGRPAIEPEFDEDGRWRWPSGAASATTETASGDESGVNPEDKSVPCGSSKNY